MDNSASVLSVRMSDHAPSPVFGKQPHHLTKQQCGDDSTDDEPLINIKTKLQLELQAAVTEPTWAHNCSRKCKQVGNTESTHESSDDESLVQMLTKNTSVDERKSLQCFKKQSEDKGLVSQGIMLTYSDNEPLIKMTRTAPVKTSATTHPVKTKEDNSVQISLAVLEGNSDDELLINMKKKLRAQPKTKEVATRSIRVGHVSTNYDSDDEPLFNMKRKLITHPLSKAVTITPSKATDGKMCNRSVSKKKLGSADEKAYSDDKPLRKRVKRRSRAVKSELSPISSDESFDEPLNKLVDKHLETVKRAGSRNATAMHKQGSSNESSDDEPLINLVRRRNRALVVSRPKKTAVPKSRRAAKIEEKGKNVPGSIDISDNDGLIKMVKASQITKILKVTLTKCSVKGGDNDKKYMQN